MKTVTESIFYEDDLLSSTECRDWIERTEAMGYAPAPVTTRNGPVMKPDMRNNHRVMFDAPDETERLWERIAPLLPAAWQSFEKHDRTWTSIGLNERLRFYRYEPGQIFAIHRDGHFARSDAERSFLTLLIYLNTADGGGSTDIKVDGETLRVDAVEGRALMFGHRLLHEGTPVEAGLKYVLRSDVMYSSGEAPIHETRPNDEGEM